LRRVIKYLAIVIVILGVLALASSQWGGFQVSRSLRDYPPIGSFVTVDSTLVHYVDKGAGRPVIMIHGSDGVLQDFTITVLDSIALTNHAVAFDRPGHGYSERPGGEPMTLSMAARLIHGAVNQLGFESPIILGHSYGGAVALQYALDYPGDVAGLVLIAPGCYSDGLPFLKSGEKMMKVMGPLMGRNMFVPLARAMEPSIIKPSFSPDPVDTAYQEIMREFSSRPSQFRALADEVVHFGAGLDSISPRYREIRIPTIIVAGDADGMTLVDKTGRRLMNEIPGAELIVAPGTGHMVHHVHPEVVVEAVRKLAATIDQQGR
jgi:pimeloyl-ACP methyl ester carboxylesterase